MLAKVEAFRRLMKRNSTTIAAFYITLKGLFFSVSKKEYFIYIVTRNNIYNITYTTS
jgi:hypothetical protein